MWVVPAKKKCLPGALFNINVLDSVNTCFWVYVPEGVDVEPAEEMALFTVGQILAPPAVTVAKTQPSKAKPY